MTDIRWKLRFGNYVKAMSRLEKKATLANMQDLSQDEITLMVKHFEMAQQLAVHVLRDYLWHVGVNMESPPRMVIKEAFAHGLIADGQAWIDMLEGRNQAAHVYNEDIAQELAQDIHAHFYPALEAMKKDFQKRYDQED